MYSGPLPFIRNSVHCVQDTLGFARTSTTVYSGHRASSSGRSHCLANVCCYSGQRALLSGHTYKDVIRDTGRYIQDTGGVFQDTPVGLRMRIV